MPFARRRFGRKPTIQPSSVGCGIRYLFVSIRFWPGADGERSVLEVQVLHARRRPGVGVRSRGGAGRPAECGDRQPRAEHEDDHQRRRADASIWGNASGPPYRGPPRRFRRPGPDRAARPTICSNASTCSTSRSSPPPTPSAPRGGPTRRSVGAGGVRALGARPRAGRRAARLHAPRRHGGLRVRSAARVTGVLAAVGDDLARVDHRPPVASTSASTPTMPALVRVRASGAGAAVHAATAP